MTSVLDGGGGVASKTLRPLYPLERPGTHRTGGWVGPRAGLDGCRKYRPPPEFDPRTIKVVELDRDGNTKSIFSFERNGTQKELNLEL